MRHWMGHSSMRNCSYLGRILVPSVCPVSKSSVKRSRYSPLMIQASREIEPRKCERIGSIGFRSGFKSLYWTWNIHSSMLEQTHILSHGRNGPYPIRS
jgi:hypothetical protein